MVVVVDELVVEVELVLDVTVELGAKEVVSSGIDDSWISELLPQLGKTAKTITRRTESTVFSAMNLESR